MDVKEGVKGEDFLVGFGELGGFLVARRGLQTRGLVGYACLAYIYTEDLPCYL